MSKPRGIIDRCVSTVVRTMFSNRTKRLIFLSTFLAYIQGPKHQDKQLACKINQLLSLAHRDSAILTPPILQEKIWSGIIPRDKPIGESGVVLCDLTEIADYRVNSSQARYVSNRIIAKIPEALKYGSNRQIRADLMMLLVNLPRLQHS